MQSTIGHIRGTPGYFPDSTKHRDGSHQWDVWSLGAMILECDMEIDVYM